MESSHDTDRVKGLKQYQDKTDEEIEEIRSQLDGDLKVTDQFVNGHEKKKAIDLKAKYLEEFSIETISDKNNLKMLIYLEILLTRFQKTLNKITSATKAPPVAMVNSLLNTIEKITEIKEKLNLTGKGDNDKSVIGILKKKFKKHNEENQGSRTFVCPHCGKMALLKIRTDKYDVQAHPFFKDRVLYSKRLVELYLEGKITKEDVAGVLECSPDYIDWLVNKQWVRNPHYQEKSNQSGVDSSKAVPQ